MKDNIKEAQSVAVIGLGPAGISQLHAFKELENKGISIPRIVCYEKQQTPGGLWNKTWRTGIDSSGESVHSSIYNNLWTNGPKECMELPNYTFDQHFGASILSYVPYEMIKNFLDGYYENSKISHWVKFNTVVRNVKYSSKNEMFKVSVHDFTSDSVYNEYHDYLIVATGHFSTPNTPSFKGLETFPGRILHSHDFRDAREFEGKDVVIIGSSFSAEDIGSQCLKYGANSITLGYRTNPTGFSKASPKWQECQLLQEINGSELIFNDGKKVKADAIIMCTGYKHHFPFLEDSLRLRTDNKLWVDNLYNGVVWEGNTKLFYVGMQDQFYTFSMFATQAWYVRDVIMGRILLPPSIEEMKNEDKQWAEQYQNLKTVEEKIKFQGGYVKHLMSLTDYPKFNIDDMNETYIQWAKNKYDHPLSYRDFSHTSSITGSHAIEPKQPWFENKSNV